MNAPDRWDVFCRVVDHFGDAGIAWRIARQLADASQRAVRLFVDGIEVLAAIEPRLDPRGASQSLDGVAIAPWPFDDDGPIAMPDVVVELLGCGLPPRYVDAMAAAARRSAAPVWIDYEHLSAEPWVDGFHRLPSPHPTLPLVKHFFYPGFGARTGGLPIERDLVATIARDAESGDEIWRAAGVAPPAGDERRLSLFAYPDAPVDALATALANDRRQRWTLIVPAGAPGPSSEMPHAVTVPFTDQPTYDRLLRACDVNFVRGEDSFVRAQVAGRPMVWQAYVQPDGAHLAKVAAFEARYAAAIPSTAAERAQRDLQDAWNRADAAGVAAAAPAWLAALPVLAAAARRWQASLLAEAPLVERLAAFVDPLRGPARGSDGQSSAP